MGMKGIYFVVLATIYNVVLGIQGPSCFKFTWVATGNSSKNVSCEDHKQDNPYDPCIEPVLHAKTKPDLWNIVEKHLDYVCDLGSDNVCVQYIYRYKNAVVNASYFCGKVTADLMTPVTSECYIQYTQGYTKEVCACESKNNSRPCNSTIRDTCSILIVFMVTAVPLFMYKIFNIS